jgi:hypothetical protein
MDYIREVCANMGPGHDCDYSLETLKADRRGSLFWAGISFIWRLPSLGNLWANDSFPDRTYPGRTSIAIRPSSLSGTAALSDYYSPPGSAIPPALIHGKVLGEEPLVASLPDKELNEADKLWAATQVMKKPTETQARYLSFIYYYTKVHRVPPAESDMQMYFQVS